MEKFLKVIVIGAIGSLISISLNASCTIKEDNGKPDIWFNGITDQNFDLNDYAESGQLSLTATVKGKGNTAKFSAQSRYKKVGNRLEISAKWVTVPVTMDEFKEQFGLFPEIICTSP